MKCNQREESRRSVQRKDGRVQQPVGDACYSTTRKESFSFSTVGSVRLILDTYLLLPCTLVYSGAENAIEIFPPLRNNSFGRDAHLLSRYASPLFLIRCCSWSRLFFFPLVRLKTLPLVRLKILPFVPGAPVHAGSENAVEFEPPVRGLFLHHHLTKHSVQGLR